MRQLNEQKEECRKLNVFIETSNKKKIDFTQNFDYSKNNSYYNKPFHSLPIHSFSGSVYKFDSNLVTLKNDLIGCPFIDQNGNKCDQKVNSSNNTHRVFKNCPNILQQKKIEQNSKAMIFNDDKCRRIDC